MWHLQKIPKTLHLYWGNDTISFLRYLTVYTFQKFNPDWTIKLYYPRVKYSGKKTWLSNEHSVAFTGENYIDQLYALPIEKIEVDFGLIGLDNEMPEPFKADYLRWLLLSSEGGLWSDFDIIYFKPMSNLYINNSKNTNINTLVCFNNQDENFTYYSIGFLMSDPGNEFYRFLKEESYKKLNILHYQSIGSKLIKYHFGNEHIITAKYPHIKIANLKMSAIYPFSASRVRHIFTGNNQHYITEDAIGIHWYAGHHISGHNENILTDINYMEHDNVISSIIAQVIK